MDRRSSPPAGERLWEWSRTLASRPTWLRRARDRAVARPSPAVPPGRTTPTQAAPPAEATPVPTGPSPSPVVPAVALASPAELDGFRRTRLISSRSQLQWHDEAGLRTTAGRRNRRGGSRKSDHPQSQFSHDVHLAFDCAGEGNGCVAARRRAAACRSRSRRGSGHCAPAREYDANRKRDRPQDNQANCRNGRSRRCLAAARLPLPELQLRAYRAGAALWFHRARSSEPSLRHP